jgi:Ca2+-binding RTX toxin-like protein
MVPSTLSVDLTGNAQLLASPAISHNITLSEKLLVIEPPPHTEIPIHSFFEKVITDTADKINVTGPGASRFSGSGTNQVITIQPVASLFVSLSGTDTVNVQAIDYATTVRHFGPGVDTVNVGSAGRVSDIQGPLTVEEVPLVAPAALPLGGGSTHLVVDDSADTTPRAVTIGANSIQFSGSSPITCGFGVKSVDVFGGTSDTFTVQTGSATTPVSVHGGAGANTVVSGAGINDWLITGFNAAKLHNVSFTNVQNLRGGAASIRDTFHFNNASGIAGSIAGSGVAGSVATLDYSNDTIPVIVDLKLNVAQTGGFTTNVFNIQNVFGGQGGNILVGNGNNFLRGGNGRDLLISGGGTSTLQAGGGEAILIGAHALFDTNFAALDAIQDEWAHTYVANPLVDYQIRVNHLKFGGGLNGSNVITPGSVIPQPGVTTLVTGGGLDFLVIDPGDVVAKPLRPGEVALFV